MQFDALLKSLLAQKESFFLRQLFGEPVAEWVTSELPHVEAMRPDLAGWLSGGRLAHLELQSTKNARMAWRMLAYGVAFERAYQQFPEQLVLYVGRDPLRMNPILDLSRLNYRFRLVDAKDLDASGLLGSPMIEDRLLAML